MRDLRREVHLGLGANLPQFVLLVVINAFVDAMIGLERTILPEITAVRITGVSEARQQEIVEEIQLHHDGKPFDRAVVEDDILRLSGTDRYEVIGYRLAPADSGTALVLDIREKSYGPPFLLPATASRLC